MGRVVVIKTLWYLEFVLQNVGDLYLPVIRTVDGISLVFIIFTIFICPAFSMNQVMVCLKRMHLKDIDMFSVSDK